MKRSKSSHPILLSQSSQTSVNLRPYNFHNDNIIESITEKSNNSESEIEKTLADAEKLYKEGEYESALLKFTKGASLKPKSEAFALGIKKSRSAILNDLKERGDSVRLIKGEGGGHGIKNFQQDYPFFPPDFKSMVVQKATHKKNFYPKTTCRSENNDSTEIKIETARSIFTKSKKCSSENFYNLKIYDGNKYKIISATTQDVKEYLKDNDYFKMKEKNAKEWKKLRSEMNKKVAEKEAIERYEAEAKLLEEKNNIRHYCEEQITLIGRYYQYGKIQDVIRFSDNFIKYLNKKADKMLSRKWIYLATTFNYLGRAFIEQNDFEKAKSFGEKLYKIAISSGNTELISQSYILSGKIYVKFFKFEEAAFVWEKLIPLIEDQEKKAWLFHEIGRCYFELKKFDISLKYGSDSFYWAEKCSSSKWLCSAKVLLGQCEMKRGNYTKALEHFIEAKKHAKINNDESTIKYIISIEEVLNAALNKQKFINDTGTH